METKVTLFELAISLIPLIMAFIGGWIHMKVTVSSLKTQLDYVQKELTEEKDGNKKSFESLTTKIDSIFGKIAEVRELILKK